MKPRIKLSCSGKLTLITEGESGLTEDQVRRGIYKRFGTLKAFCRHFHLPYGYLCEATQHQGAASRGGKIADVRRILGLPVRTKRLGLAQVAAHARRSAK